MGFGARLQKARKDKNISQEELAKQLGIARSSVANYETDRNFPTTDILDKISKSLDCSTDYLLGISDKNFFRVMQTAKEKGYTPEDLELAMNFIDRARKRDNKDEN